MDPRILEIMSRTAAQPGYMECISAIQNGNVEKIKSMISKNPAILNYENTEGGNWLFPVVSLINEKTLDMLELFTNEYKQSLDTEATHEYNQNLLLYIIGSWHHDLHINTEIKKNVFQYVLKKSNISLSENEDNEKINLIERVWTSKNHVLNTALPILLEERKIQYEEVLKSLCQTAEKIYLPFRILLSLEGGQNFRQFYETYPALVDLQRRGYKNRNIIFFATQSHEASKAFPYVGRLLKQSGLEHYLYEKDETGENCLIQLYIHLNMTREEDLDPALDFLRHELKDLKNMVMGEPDSKSAMYNYLFTRNRHREKLLHFFLIELGLPITDEKMKLLMKNNDNYEMVRKMQIKAHYEKMQTEIIHKEDSARKTKI